MSVSHIVIINVSNDIPDRFMDILSICNDSLKHLIGNHYQSSIIHLVVNQISLFNTDNHPINSNKTLKQYQQHFISNSNINITQDAIHFLPVGFRKDFLSTRIYTEQIFSECTQDLSMKIIHSSLTLSSTTLSKWLNTAILFFDVLQETPTISSFQNLTERSHDDYILDYIRHRLFELLTPAYRQQLLKSVVDKSSDEIDQLFDKNIRASEDSLQSEIDDRLKLMKASKSIRERSKHFLQRQINEIFDGWRQEAIVEANHQRFSFENNQNSPKNKSNMKNVKKK
jgi:hypothetical protein